jgi:hypothetical protein
MTTTADIQAYGLCPRLIGLIVRFRGFCWCTRATSSHPQSTCMPASWLMQLPCWCSLIQRALLILGVCVCAWCEDSSLLSGWFRPPVGLRLGLAACAADRYTWHTLPAATGGPAMAVVRWVQQLLPATTSAPIHGYSALGTATAASCHLCAIHDLNSTTLAPFTTAL